MLRNSLLGTSVHIQQHSWACSLKALQVPSPVLPRSLLISQVFPLPELTAGVIFFSPKSIADGRVADSRQTEVQELWTGKISHKTGTQCSNDNRKKTIYKFFPSCKISLPNKYLHKQKRNKHMTGFAEGLVLLTEKLMPPNWWHLSNIIHHLLSWASV